MQPKPTSSSTLSPGTWPFTITLAMLTALLPLSTDMYLPSLPSILIGLTATPVSVQWTLSALMVGMAAGQVVSGPLSDVYGRRPILLAGLGVYCFAALLCAIAPNIETLITGRALQGFALAGPAVLARAVVRDLYQGAHAGREMSRMGAIMGLVPGVGPALGGLLEQYFGWRGNFLFACLFASVLAFVVGRRLPETLPARGASWPGIVTILRGYPSVLRVGRWWFYAGTLVLSHSGLFLFISGSSFVLQKTRGLSPFEFGIAFGMTALAYASGAFLAQRIVRRQGLDRTILIGTILVAGAGIAAALFAAFGFSHIAALVGPMIVYLAGHGLAQPQCQAGALTPFPHNAGAASSLLGIAQMVFSAMVGLYFASWLAVTPDALPYGLAMAGCATLTFFLTARLLRHQPQAV